MRRPVVGILVGLLCLGALLGCTGSDATSAERPVAGSECDLLARDIVERLDRFLEPFATLTPEEFLAQPELPGLTEFQNDVAAIIGRPVPLDGTACGPARLESTLDAALSDYAGTSLLADFLVASIRTGDQRSVRNVAVEPGDDIARVLGSLATGSSITFGAGTFEISEAMLVQTGVTLAGAGIDATILNSTAADAAMAVFGEGDLVMQDLTLRHSGDAPASVLVVFKSPVDLFAVRLAGAVADDQGAGGSGLVLSGDDITSAAAGAAAGVPTATATTDAIAADAELTESRVVESELSDNGGAGIVAISDRHPSITDSMIVRNGRCGICYFDDAGGVARRNTIEENGLGIQAGNRSVAEISDNKLSNNTVAGIVADGDSTLAILSNTIEGNGEVGIEVQGAAAPEIRDNTFGAQPVGLSIRGTSEAFVRENRFDGADVAIQVSGDAQPTVMANDIEGTTIAGILHSENSRGSFEANMVTITQGAGVSVGGDSAPSHRATMISGGDVGFAYSANGAGTVREAKLMGQQVGIAVVDDAKPMIEDSQIEGSAAAAVVFRDRAAGELRTTTITDPVTIGLQLGGTAAPLIDSNTIEGGETGVLIIEDTTAELTGNTLTGQQIALAIGGDSNTRVAANEVTKPRDVGVLVQENATGVITKNNFVDVGLVAIRVGGTAEPEVTSNTMFAALATSDGNGSQGPAASGVGLLYEDDATGTVRDNNVFGFAIGAQIGGSSTPVFEANLIDGAGVGAVGFLYDGESAGRANKNTVTNVAIGFQLSGSSSAAIDANTITDATAGAMLLQGSTTVSVTANTCTGAPLGIVVTEQADPTLADNTC